MSSTYLTTNGSRYPLGSRAYPHGVNFSIVSQAASAAELRLYDSHDSPSPFQIIKLDPRHHRTYIYWHVFVQDLKPGVFYTWRLDGPSNTTQSGLRFNIAQDLLDPWARGITDTLWHRRSATRGDTCHSMRALVLPPKDRRRPADRVHRR